jgi:flagellar FliJ protein
VAKFKFSLEAVLKHRRMVEEQCQRDLAEAMSQRVALRDELRRLQETISESKRALSGGLVGAVNLESIANFARYSSQATQRARGCVMKLAGVEKTIEAARQKLLAATRARKALDLLRDRRHEQWVRDEDRRETAVLDEVAMRQHARRAELG